MMLVADNIATSKLVQVTVEIDGSETHVIEPEGDESSFDLDDSESKEFCLEGKHSINSESSRARFS